MRFRWIFSVLALLTIVFAANSGAQTGAGSPPQFTPEQIAKMPVKALPVRDFKLLSPNTGWVSTGNRLLFTTDNGAHWKDISPPVPAPSDPRDNKFSGVFFLDANTGWVVSAVDTNDTTPYGTDVGSDALLSSTTDGGATWTTMKLPRADTVRESGGGGSIAFSDRLHGWFDLGLTGNTAVQPAALFKTSDGGRTWQHVKGDPGVGVEIVALTEEDVWFAGGPDYKLYVTHDGANTVQEVPLSVPDGIPADDYPTYGLPVFTSGLNGYEEVMYTGGNGDKSAAVLFATGDGGRTWKPDRILSNLAESSAGSSVESAVAGSTWIVPFAASGQPPTLLKLHPNDRTEAPAHKSGGDFRRCSLSFLTPDEGWFNCSGRLSSTADGGATLTEITPRVRNGVLTADPVTPVRRIAVQPRTIKLPGKAKAAINSAASLDSPILISYVSGIDQHLGFDRTDVLPIPDMQAWWNSSPYYDVGIYLPGSPNRHNDRTLVGDRGQKWVDAVIGQGWGIIPIWFGLQAPCSAERFPHQFSASAKDAEAQGEEQATRAYASATALGLDGTIVYFDLEPYDSNRCGAAARAYIGGLVNEMHELVEGSSVGVYTDVFSAAIDSYNARPVPDDVWIYLNPGHRVTVWGLNQGRAGQMLRTALTDDMWPNKRRMHQYRIPTRSDPVIEQWGGAGPYNIDEDIVDATIVPGSGQKSLAVTASYTLVDDGPNSTTGLWGIANGVNNSGFQNGEAVGWSYNSPTTGGFTYSGGQAPTTTTLFYSGAIGTSLTGVNNLGQIVGTYDLGQVVEGNSQVISTNGLYARSKNATPETLNYDATYTYLNGINDAGWIVGNYTNDNVTFHCVLFKPDKKGAYSKANAIPFDVPGATSTWCPGINGLGQILVGWMAGDVLNEMVDDAEGGDLDTPANFSPMPNNDFEFLGINNNGQMIGDYDALLNGSELVYIQQESNVAGFYVLYGINDDAQMAGMLEEPIVEGVEGPTVGLILNVLPTQP
jgi:photosystem II stability/assembly factor-like uncharacterized protein